MPNLPKMSPDRPQIAFSDADWERLERDWTAWWNHDLERPLIMTHSWRDDGRRKPEWWDGRQFGGIPPEVGAEDIAEQAWLDLACTGFHGDAWPRLFPNFGPGVGAAFMGGRLESSNETRTTWFHPGRWDGVPLRDIKPVFDQEQFWFRRVQDITKACLARFNGGAQVSFTDIGGGLDLAASLRDTQNLLMDCLDDPDGVAGFASRITPLWIRYYREQCALISPAGRGTSPWASIWSAGRCYMLQCDFSYMISPSLFERFVLPDLSESCAAMDHGFYHLDGKGQLPHLDHLLSIPALKGVQWIPGDGNPESGDPVWWPVLKRIRDAGKLVQLYLSGDCAMRLAREKPLAGFAITVYGGKDQDAMVSEILKLNARLSGRKAD